MLYSLKSNWCFSKPNDALEFEVELMFGFCLIVVTNAPQVSHILASKLFDHRDQCPQVSDN